MKLETMALHVGYEGDPVTRAATTPIYQTTSYTFDNTQHGADLFNLVVPGNIYSRIMNPTNAVLEARLTAMEGGVGALAMASGMAAITAAIQCICRAGDNIVSTSQLYGGTYNLFAHTLPGMGIETRFASFDDHAGLEALIDERTRAVFCESIGNPAGNVVDIEALAKIAHRHGVPLIVDNTVATPVLCRVFDYGADISIHSLTKYIGGHGTTIGGIIGILAAVANRVVLIRRDRDGGLDADDGHHDHEFDKGETLLHLLHCAPPEGLEIEQNQTGVRGRVAHGPACLAHCICSTRAKHEARRASSLASALKLGQKRESVHEFWRPGACFPCCGVTGTRLCAQL